MGKDFTGNLIPKRSTDSIAVAVNFNWRGPASSIEAWFSAGYRDFIGAYTDKTGHTIKQVNLPNSPGGFTPGNTTANIPLNAWGGEEVDDGAIEVIFKIPGMPDYIVHIWDAYVVQGDMPEAFDVVYVTIS